VPLVSRIVDELRAAHPSHVIELEGETAAEADVDADRFERVVSNLVGNAVTHGDPERPVRVRVGANGRLTVCNQGPPIPAEFLAQLFDPFSRARKPEGRSDGLGLGLYISERIVRAHGGAIQVTSSLEAGTCFDVCFAHGD
jgi:signal transduction histidine kinase